MKRAWLVAALGCCAAAEPECRIEPEACCYVHFDRRTNLELRIRTGEATFLDVNEEKSEFMEWVDDLGNPIGDRKGIGFSGSHREDDGASYTFGVDKVAEADAKRCAAKGTLAVRLGLDEKSGQTEVVAAKVGESLDVGGIPFTVSQAKTWPFKDDDGNPQYILSIRCARGDYAPEDYDLMETLELLDGSGAVLEKHTNQDSAWSDASGKSGFEFNWIRPELPESFSLRYRFWGRIMTVEVPFEVSAEIKR